MKKAKTSARLTLAAIFLLMVVLAVVGVTGIPASVLFDPEGKVVANDLRGDDLSKKLEELLK